MIFVVGNYFFAIERMDFVRMALVWCNAILRPMDLMLADKNHEVVGRVYKVQMARMQVPNALSVVNMQVLDIFLVLDIQAPDIFSAVDTEEDIRVLVEENNHFRPSLLVLICSSLVVPSFQPSCIEMHHNNFDSSKYHMEAQGHNQMFVVEMTHRMYTVVLLGVCVNWKRREI